MHQVMMKPTTFFFIRHAKSVANLSNDKIGGVDAVLAPEGIEEARCLNAYLLTRPDPQAFVYCSNMPRATGTAELLAEGLRTKPMSIVTDQRLREIDRGHWEGMARAETYNEEIRADMAFLDMDHRAPGGESMSDVATRVRSWLQTCDRMIEGRGISTFVAITHAMVIKTLLQRLFDMDPRSAWLIEIANTSITKVRCSEHGWHLEYVNRTPHLPERGL